MNKEIISDKQGIALMVLFLTGTSTSYIVGVDAKEDFWISIILAVFVTVFMISIYIYFTKCFPGKDLFDINEICFGKYIGKIINILFIWYAFSQGTHKLMDIIYFIDLTALSGTPLVVIMIFVGFLCIYIIKAGFEVIARFSEFFWIPFILFNLIEMVLLIPQMDFNALRPTLNNTMKPVLKGALSAFTFPFGDILVGTMIISSLQNRKSPFKIYSISLFISSIIILLGSFRNILVLGINTASSMYFPSYGAAARISIGDFLQRVEIVVPVIYVLGGFINYTVYCFITCKGTTKIFGCKEYRIFVTPIIILMICFSYTLHYGIVDYFEWYYNVWRYYYFPFQFILPILVFIGVVVKRKVSKTRL